MFTYKIDEHTELRLLEHRHAEQLFQLTDQSRESLREWLPWIDFTRTVADSRTSSVAHCCSSVGMTAFKLAFGTKGSLPV